MKNFWPCTLLCCLLFPISAAMATEPPTLSNDFIRDHGEVSIISEYTLHKTGHFWNAQGDRKDAFNRLDQTIYSIFMEYGLTCRDTVGLYVEFADNYETINWSERGFHDLELCWKHYWTSINDYQIATRVIGIVPTGPKQTTVRYGKCGAEFDLHCQKDFEWCDRCGWVEALAGYRYYYGFPSDQLKMNVIAGYQLFSRLTLVGSLYLNYGLFNGEKEGLGPVLTLPARYRLLSGKIHGVLNLTRYLSLFLGCYQHFWGEDIGTGAGYYAGLWIDF